MVHKHGLTWVAIFAIIALMFLQLPPMVAKQDTVLNTYRALVEVDALAKQNYVEPIHGDHLVDGAIRGMMLQLDPYSGYIAPHELPAFERRNRGDYIGIGIEVGLRGGRLTVISPIEDSPAAKAGILAGDVILAVEGTDIEGLSVFDVDELLAGRRGTAVSLLVQHAGEFEPETVTVTHDWVSIRTVRGFRRDTAGNWDYMIDPAAGIAYIRISNFHRNTMPDFEAALCDILRHPAAGIVLDLRFNPGGLMDQAVAMVDRFVDQGVIVSTVTRRQAVHQYFATPGAINPQVQLAVLINVGSASASEIVAGALQAHGQAVVVGSRSFGKGSVQHLIPLESHEAAIKLTVAYYCLPNGRIIHRTRQNEDTDTWGVQPDLEVILTEDEIQAIQKSRHSLDLAFTASSAMLTGHSGIPGTATTSLRPPEIVRDRQLIEALAILRGQIETAAAPAH
jgi:carboxyl-terminal processing protease